MIQLKKPDFINRFVHREVSLRDRFVVRVLFPPFLLLMAIGGIGFWQLNAFLQNQSIEDLRMAARTTAIRLEREIAIRQTILKNTAEEIAEVKNAYVSDLEKLEKERAGCREHYLKNFRFTGAPGGLCDTFIQASSGTRPSLTVIEDVYLSEAKALQSTEINSINQRLSTFKQFFPETAAFLVIGEDGRIISSAVSGAGNVSSDMFREQAVAVREKPLAGEVITSNEVKLSLFAFPTEQGAVLVAFDVNNDAFIRPAWLNTPVDSSDALPIILHPDQRVVFPNVRDENELLQKTASLDEAGHIVVELSDIENIVVSEPIKGTVWTVAIASPEAIVFETLRDTQFITVVIAGIFIIGFLWVGSFFIQRTTNNIAQLVTAAMVFGTGRLDYKLELSESEKEFRQLADTMNYMARRIAQNEQEMDERNKEFISIATHELRAPMTSIIGYLSMMQENIGKKLDKENKLLFDSAYDGTIKLRDLINDMLDAARLEGGREEFVIRKLSIADYIEACLTSMQVVAQQKKIKLHYDKKGAGLVYADEAKLRIILNNFVSNAIKYNKEEGYVKITHSRENDQLVTAIANNGPSIPADQQVHMFEKFFRVDTPEHRKVTGTGIGMFVTKQYIEAQKGKVWFSSSPGEDTIFFFSLPMQGEESSMKPPSTSAQSANSKWIMRWRRRLR